MCTPACPCDDAYKKKWTVDIKAAEAKDWSGKV